MFELAETLAAAGRVLHRGRRRAAGRHRRARRRGARLHGVPLLRRAVAGSCRWSASTRAAASPATPRCSAAATSSSRPRTRTSAWAGPAMIEGGGLGVFRPEEVGPMDVQVRERRRRRRGRRRGRGGARSRKQYLSYFQGALRDVGVRRPARAARDRPGEPPARLRRAARDRDARRHRLGARAAPRLRARHGDGARARRGPAARRRSPTTRRTSPARSTATAPTRRRASCSSATPSTCPSSSSATRRASWSGPRSRRPRSCATRRACSSPARA